ncbi:pyruvate/2-oxoglutarate dehydrogenase complex dihydrolipoamide dehydrogenase (E3) component [Sinorhizobium medicae]|uniref:FAD-dependent oxidoreductase n=1 Tax=Sinorhizobium medicae TaxID=110321 RepID=UPI00119AF6B4|nr:FAD-dependent oxidoreductase [Sinorhizobium medicae]MDX0424057.1 FAD-dependent oxidoreductase [Sinorhizobium medicae]TWA24662.1 pyruvate/2-oxoglutarate dehydrogenase complex dihydrolipoamide dehydrogenase (E3) component [Sinorhizobium medicae]TWA44002.1 pyruvate/2-oxoglutarate dehydrogenase complex dihydrolipoamide dehydrogenase (E3) component [Sinorhizobium medicae]
MREADIIVVGGGPAGVSAAVEAAKSGLSVVLCEQRPALGGAIHRQPAEGAAPVAALPSLARRWQSLSAKLSASPVEVRTRRAFVGIDSTGAVLIDDRAAGKVEVRRPRALILACGAVERVRPRPGWHLPGVAAAGGLQVMLKEGRVPEGRVLLAGSGPLLLALAAQMTAAGNPPVAVVEEGDPVSRPLAATRLLTHPFILPDMAVLMMPVLLRRFLWRRGTRLTEITQSADMLSARLRAPDGREERFEVDRIGLHDGLRANDFGLTADPPSGLVILRAGDLREVLGAHAAEADGAEAGREAAARLEGRPPCGSRSAMRRHRALQHRLSRIFAPAQGATVLRDCPDETVICRCEGRTIGHLKEQLAGPDAVSARELRLNGRFGMGACQGRFCSEWALSLMSELRRSAGVPASPPDFAETGVCRWPLRPVALSSLANAGIYDDTRTERHIEGISA